jgi:hypothetical protein
LATEIPSREMQTYTYAEEKRAKCTDIHIIGLSTDPLGIPDITSFHSDISSFMDTHWYLSVRNPSIHPNIG